LAGLERVAGQEFVGGEAAAAFALQDEDPEGIETTSDHDAGLSACKIVPGGPESSTIQPAKSSTSAVATARTDG